MSYKISIIIPVYNIEDYIGRCLESVINQTYKNLEIIVVNDGSTDDSFNVINDYASIDSRIKIINQNNLGVSKARLAGMKISSGYYVGFVDGDDVIDSDMYEFLVKNAIEYNADISHCGYVMDFPDGHHDYYYNSNKIIVQNHDDGLKDLLSGEVIEPALCNKIYKKEIINKFINNVEMDYSIKYLEDLLVNFFLFSESSKSIYIDCCKYHYVLRNSSADKSINRNKLTDPLNVFKRLLIINKNNKSLINIIFKRYVRCLINIINQDIYLDLQTEARNELKSKISYFKIYSLPYKERIMSYCVIYFLDIYKMIRKIYNFITHVDKKYEIE